MGAGVFFVILHYQAVEETRACVESILNNYKKVRIVVVDNASPNKSGIELKEEYANNRRVEGLLSDQNLGFARGNNLGYRHAKDRGADFVIQVNNDTIFDDPEFVNKIQTLYDEEHFAVLGPDVICLKDGTHQNPLKGFTVTKTSILVSIIKNCIGLFLANFGADTLIKRTDVYQPNWENPIDISKSNSFVLQGCCYIFSRDYIEVMDGMFEGTFMYYEEHILNYICRQKNLKMIYSPCLKLSHLRQASTSSAISSSKEKRKFKYRQSIHSLVSFYMYLVQNG